MKRTRWLILLILVGLVLVLGATAYLYRQNQQRRHIESLGPKGIALVEQGEYQQALPMLGGYVRHHPRDVDALHALAEARLAVSLPGSQHLAQAITVYQQIVDVDPEDVDALRSLMDLYQRANYSVEAIDAADRLMARVGPDAEAMWVKAAALVRLRRFDEGLQTVESLLEMEPLHLRANLAQADLAQQAGLSDDDILARPFQLLSEYPDDPRPRLFLSNAQRVVGNVEAAERGLDAVIDADPAEPELVRLTVQFLDAAGRYNDSIALLERAAQAEIEAPAGADADAGPAEGQSLRGDLVGRLWNAQRLGTITSMVEEGRLDPQVNPEQAHFAVLALLSTDRLDEADALLANEAIWSHSDFTQTWSRVLKRMAARGRSEDAGLEAFEQMLADAVERFPGDAQLRYLLAETQARRGSTELAVQNWIRVTQAARSWSLPYARIAETFLQTNRANLALEPGLAAYRRAPTARRSVVAYLRAIGANLDRIPPERMDDIASALEQLSAQAPVTELLPVRAELIARRQGPEAAQRFMTDQMAAHPELAGEVLNGLLAVADRYGIELFDRVWTRVTERSAVSPNLAFAAAVRRAREQGPEAALGWFDEQAGSLGAADTAPWLMTRARLVSVVQPEEARALWADISERFAEDATVQTVAIQQAPVWEDLALARAVADRIAERLGEDAVWYRIAQARLILEQDPNERQLADAVTELIDLTDQMPYLAQPHLLLGLCFEQLGNTERALEAYSEAQRLAPERRDLTAKRASLLAQSERLDEAVRLLSASVEQGEPGVQELTLLATLRLAQGQPAAALELSRRAAAMDPDNLDAARLMGRAYRRLGQAESAVPIYEKMLASSDLALLADAAAFFSEIGRVERMETALRAMDQLDADPGTVAMVRGEILNQARRFADAQEAFQQATASGNDAMSIRAYQRVCSLQLARGEHEAFMATLQEAANRHPGFDAFTQLAAHPDWIAVGEDRYRQRLVIGALSEPARLEDALEALRIVHEMMQGSVAPVDGQVLLRRLADRNPRFAALQDIAVRAYLATGQVEDAAELAARSMDADGGTLASMSLAVDAYLASGQAEKALSLAESIGERYAGAESAVDVAAARALIQQGKAREAWGRLEPRINASAALEENSSDPLVAVAFHAALAAGLTPSDAPALVPLLQADAAAASRLVQTLPDHALDADTALAWLDVFDASAPGDARAGLLVGQIQHRLGIAFDRPGLRSQGLDRVEAVSRDAQVSTESAMAMGMMFERERQWDRAAVQYRRVLELQPRAVVAMNNLAMVLVRTGQTAEAVTMARRASELAPNQPVILDTLAHSLLADGQLDEATQAVREAIRLDPLTPDWRVTLGLVQLRNDRPEEARRTLLELERLLAERPLMDPNLADGLSDLRQALAD